ncbi:MAG: hypothetical protein Q8Q65_00060 [bacterium]|nr:hypothetical protein [bacterium]
MLDLERIFNRDETIGVTFDGGGEVLDIGVEADIYVPYRCRIRAVTVEADQIGDLVIDIWKVAFSSFPPTILDSITGSTPPTLSSARTIQDTVLTGWTTLIEQDSSLIFSIQNSNLIKRVVVVMKVIKL